MQVLDDVGLFVYSYTLLIWWICVVSVGGVEFGNFRFTVHIRVVRYHFPWSDIVELFLWIMKMCLAVRLTS